MKTALGSCMQMPGRVWGRAQHRGVAVAGGKVFLATQDVYLVALDAKSGEVLWKTQAGNDVEGNALAFDAANGELLRQ